MMKLATEKPIDINFKKQNLVIFKIKNYFDLKTKFYTNYTAVLAIKFVVSSEYFHHRMADL
jgi:hypothetical protein